MQYTAEEVKKITDTDFLHEMYFERGNRLMSMNWNLWINFLLWSLTTLTDSKNKKVHHATSWFLPLSELWYVCVKCNGRNSQCQHLTVNVNFLRFRDERISMKSILSLRFPSWLSTGVPRLGTGHRRVKRLAFIKADLIILEEEWPKSVCVRAHV